MKRFLLFSTALAGLTAFAPVIAETNTVGLVAPAPILVTMAGRYEYLSKLYYEGTEHPRQPRSLVVLNFMGLKCPPCRKELPLFLEVMRHVTERSKDGRGRIKFFLVSTDPLSDKDELRKFMEEQKIDPNTELLLDPYRKACEKFGVTGIPRTFVISPQGRIAAEVAGSVEDYKTLLENGISDALKAEEGK